VTIDCVTGEGLVPDNDRDVKPCFVCMSDFLTLLGAVVISDDDDQEVGIGDRFSEKKKRLCQAQN